MRFHRSLQDFHSILTDFNNAIVWIVSILTISKSSSLSSKRFGIIIIVYSFRVFHISVSWWFFTGVWVTACLLKSPGLFSVFWPFLIMLLFGWSPLGRQLLNLPGPIGIIVTLMFHSFFNSLARSRYLSLFSHSFSFILWPAGTPKSRILQIFFFFCWLL